MDQLRNALSGAFGVAAPPKDPGSTDSNSGNTATGNNASGSLPDPLASPWVELLRRSGTPIPENPTLGQLRARSDQLLNAMKADGRRREAEALGKARSSFEKDLEKAAWAEVKERFVALELPERAYRALKQEGADPLALLLKLKAKRAEELRGGGADRVRDALKGK